ncbi:MAG: ATP-binding cassette domain-containing protein [Acidobacteriota bacterium]
MALPAIRFDDVTIRFRVARRGASTLKEWAIRKLTSGLAYEDREALSEVSFELQHGESLGVIGANGAGKSTLLRVAAGILQPSGGVATVRGRVAPLIELGTGFDGDLTGRENVLFNGALLGRSRVEMERRFEEIVAFSGLARHIDAPLRTYSTGMVARLAFAVAISVDAEVLLLDEILSVGDELFRRRCRKRIDAFRRAGTTVVLVSHDLATIERFCTRALLLDEGRVIASGPVGEVVSRYRKEIRALGRRRGAEAAIAAGVARDPAWRTSRAGVAAALVGSVHGGDYEPPPASGVFGDLPPDHPDAPYAEELNRLGITHGFSDGSFRPGDAVTRAQMAVFVVLARHGRGFVPPRAEGSVRDVPRSHWAAAHVEQLIRDGAATPFDDGTFRPDEPLDADDLERWLEHALE